MTIPQSISSRPPLTARQRRGAVLAGAVGFAMIAIGLSGLVALTAFAVLWFLLVVLVGGFADAFGPESGRGSFASDWGGFLVSLFGPLGIAAAVVALALVVFGFLVSRWILRAHGVARPGGVTWAGFGVALAAFLLAGGVFGGVISAVAGSASSGAATDDPFDSSLGGLFTALFGFGSLVVAAGLGALCWWWMAHALRARASAAPHASPLPPPLASSVAPGGDPAAPAPSGIRL